MKRGGRDYADEGYVLVEERIEKCVKLARWIVAEGMSHGNEMAYKIISREDFTPIIRD